jgi:hypothetical protein
MSHKTDLGMAEEAISLLNPVLNISYQDITNL